MRRLVNILKTVVLLQLSSLIVFCKQIKIPFDFATIQEGLNAAQPSDTVLVFPGTCNEKIVWPNTNGLLLLSDDGPESTIIDGGGLGRRSGVGHEGKAWRESKKTQGTWGRWHLRAQGTTCSLRLLTGGLFGTKKGILRPENTYSWSDSH